MTVRKIEGEGLIEPGDTTTKNGVAGFTFFAPTSGTVVFTAEVGKGASRVREVHTITIAAAMEEPEAPPVVVEEEEEEEVVVPPVMEDATLTGQGALRIFSGGSVADLDAAAEAACPGGAQIWVQDADGGWQLYSTSAPAFANAPFSTAFPDGLGLQAVFVSGCDAGSMDNEN